MGDSGKKRKITVIYIIIAVLLAAFVSVGVGLYNELHETYIDSIDYLEKFVETYDTLLTREQDEDTRIRSDLKDIARLTVAAIKRSGSEILPSQYADGAIVKATKEGIESPIELPGEITPEVFSQDDTGTCDTSDGTLIYGNIKGNLYYVEMTDPVDTAETTKTADETFAADKSQIADALENMASAHKCEYICMKAADDNSGDYEIYCATGRFRKYSRLSQMDIKGKAVADDNDSVKKGFHYLIKVDGHRYFVRFIDVGDSKVAAMLMPLRSSLMRIAEQTTLFVIALLVICILMAAWILFIHEAAKNHTISPEDREKYLPGSVRTRIKAAVLLGSLLILVSCLFTQSLESAFTETSNGSAILESVFQRIKDDRKRSDKIWKDSQDRYTAMADRVALLIDRNRELQNRDWLKEASKIIGAEFLMIFDTDGKEVISDSPYKGLTLGKSEDSPTFDFRRLLRGVKSISHAGVKDEVIGQKLDMYGIALHFLSENDAYGALILATDPSASGKKNSVDVNEIAGSMMAEKAVCFAVDPKTRLIKYSSDPSLSGKQANVYGLNKKNLREDYMGFVEIEGRRHYVTSAKYDNLLYYYAVRSSRMLGYDLRYALIVTLLSLVLLGGLAHILLKDYREEEYMAFFEDEDNPSDTETDVYHPTAADFMENSVYSFGFLNKRASPDERTGSLLLLCSAAVLVPLLIKVYFGRHSLGGDGSVIAYIGQGDWEHSINIFAVAYVIIILCQMLLILITLKFITNIVGRFIGAKGHTVCTLLYNIVFCLMVVAFVLIAMGYFGVNTQALAASFGLAGLAASLGAKDFISDIIAGITLMLDGSYKVGDIIEIDDFTGTVLKINMRKTTAMSWQGTVKTFSNSTITSVTNHSVYPYIYFLTFAIPYGCTVKKAEEIINREIPKLVGKCPAIIEGPVYDGVSDVVLVHGNLFTKMAVQAVCDYADRYVVGFFLSGEMRALFEREFDEKTRPIILDMTGDMKGE